MATPEIAFLHDQLEQRKRRLEAAITVAPQNTGLAGLLREVDAALERMDTGSYGLCEACQDPIEPDRLLADPLVCYCLDHLTRSQRDALQRDLDLASELQRRLLPQPRLRADGWETAYHYAPAGAVSGDYCDLIPADGQLFFVLGDVSGKGVAASMLMTQLHALFRSLAGMALPLHEAIMQANRVFCESALAGQYATLVCGQATAAGLVEIHNAGHWPAILATRGDVRRIESTGLPLGLFCEVDFAATRFQIEPGDTLFLYTDGLTESRRNGDEYGLERVVNVVRGNAGRRPAEMIEACLEDLRNFADAGPPPDDLTLLAIRRS